MKKIVMFLTILALNIMPVSAECTYTQKADAMKKAANVKVEYEVVEDKQNYEGGSVVNEYFKISILNVTQELYVEVTNDFNNNTTTYTFNDAEDGIVTFNWEENEVVTNFTIKVFAAGDTGCYGEELKTIRKQTPRYNDFYNRAICAEEDMKDFYLCQKYTTIKEIDESMFVNKVDGFMDGKINEEGKKTEEVKKENKALEFLKKNKWYLIGGAAVIVVGATVVVVVKRRRGDMVK